MNLKSTKFYFTLLLLFVLSIFTISCTSSGSDDDDATFASVFDKRITVFGIPVYGTNDVPDTHMQHAAKVLAQYLDNDEDGTADNSDVISALADSSGALIVLSSEDEHDELFESGIGNLLDESSAILSVFVDEMVLTGSSAQDGFDATLEEVLHLVTQGGFSVAYPEEFGESAGSDIADAMDIARGGQFFTIPDPYPQGAWYTYDDETCDYRCMITEYFYWGLTSIMGGQDFEGRLADIQNEWDLNTRALVEATDTALFALLVTNGAQFNLPTVLPDATYNGGSFTIEPI